MELFQALGQRQDIVEKQQSIKRRCGGAHRGGTLVAGGKT